jgi:uncharacterized protein YaaQ
MFKKITHFEFPKFVSDVASDALTNNCKMRQSTVTTVAKKAGKEKKYVMTTMDLSLALDD